MSVRMRTLQDVAERLDDIFLLVEEDDESPWDDRLHLTGSGIESRDKLEGALLAMMGDEDLYLIHEYNEGAETARFSVYTEDAPV